MSDNAVSNVEQITKTPSNVPKTGEASKREKDPKRVAAGKKLAENNKRMREEYAKYKALEAQRASVAPAESPAETPEPETETGGNASGEWFPKLSLTNVISLVGIGLTVYNIFMRSREKQPTNTDKKHVAWREPVTTHFEEPEVKVKPKPIPKFGM